MLFNVEMLGLRPIQFDKLFSPGELNFSGSEWRQQGDLHTEGVAELFGPAEARTVRVCCVVEATMKSVCARCLEPVSTCLEEKLELLYHPVGADIRKGSVQADGGCYEEPGPKLPEVLQEQLMLWLPMRSLCDDQCNGICVHCGINLNQGACDCAVVLLDSRWEVLGKLQIETKH